jgi:dihydropyrimidinase
MASTLDTLVHGGQVVTPAGVLETGVAIQGGRIVALGDPAWLPKARTEIDARGRIVLPGAIDSHVHLGPEYDDWRGGPHAAAYAGLTTLLVFGVYDDQRREPLPDAVRRLQAEIGRESVLDVGLHMILGNQPEVLGGLAEAVELGVTSFKMFMTYKKRQNRMCSDDFICRAMERIAALGGLTQLHCEDGDILAYLEDKALAEGRVAPADFPATCPDWAEADAIGRAIAMGALTGCPVYVVHLSTRLGLERIRAAQVAGQPVWTETCPQYLLLSEAEMVRWGPFAKIGPPLRRADGPDREALWAGSAQGVIATVGSDHAPRVPAAKEPGWQNIFVDAAGRPIPFGAPSIETLVPLVYSEGVVRRGLGLPWLARVLAENPARIFGLWPRKGAIQVGADADLLLIDPDADREIRAADHHGIAGYTLYEGWRVRGRPWLTLLRGEVLLDARDGTPRLAQAPGFGRYLPRTGPRPPVTGGPGPGR